MNALTATTKGAATREAIIDRAYDIARSAGLEGLSIGPLAQAVGMSKSGVFAHFGSREDLQLAVLDSAATRFGAAVLHPGAVAAPRPSPAARDHAELVRMGRHAAGGCVLVGSVTEYDDRPGALRDQVAAQRTALARRTAARGRSSRSTAATCAMATPSRYAFELYAIPLADAPRGRAVRLRTCAAPRRRRAWSAGSPLHSPTA